MNPPLYANGSGDVTAAANTLVDDQDPPPTAGGPEVRLWLFAPAFAHRLSMAHYALVPHNTQFFYSLSHPPFSVLLSSFLRTDD